MELKSLKMRRMRWLVVASLLLAMGVLYLVAHINNEQRLADLRAEGTSLAGELSDKSMVANRLRIQLSEVGSSSSLDAAARAENYVKPGELRFIIDNSEGQLEKYTEEEWSVMMYERKLGQY